MSRAGFFLLVQYGGNDSYPLKPVVVLAHYNIYNIDPITLGM